MNAATLTGQQRVRLNALRVQNPDAVIVIDGREDDDVRVHAIARGWRHGYVIDTDGEIVAATPLDHRGEPLSAY